MSGENSHQFVTRYGAMSRSKPASGIGEGGGLSGGAGGGAFLEMKWLCLLTCSSDLPWRRQRRAVVSTVLCGTHATHSVPLARREETASIFLNFLLVPLGSATLYVVRSVPLKRRSRGRRHPQVEIVVFV